MKSHLAKASPNGRAIETSYGRLQTVANGCELENNVGQTQLYPQTPKLNENPSLRIREKQKHNNANFGTAPAHGPRTSSRPEDKHIVVHGIGAKKGVLGGHHVKCGSLKQSSEVDGPAGRKTNLQLYTHGRSGKRGGQRSASGGMETTWETLIQPLITRLWNQVMSRLRTPTRSILGLVPIHRVHGEQTDLQPLNLHHGIQMTLLECEAVQYRVCGASDRVRVGPLTFKRPKEKQRNTLSWKIQVCTW